MVLISNACREWCWSTHTFEEQDWYALESSKLQVKKAEFTETCPLVVFCLVILLFQTGMDTTLPTYICLGPCGWTVIKSLQWCSSVGCNSQSPPVAFQCGAVSTKYFHWCSSVPNIRSVAQWYPSVNQWYSNGITVYTGPASVHWLRIKVIILKGHLDLTSLQMNAIAVWSHF